MILLCNFTQISEKSKKIQNFLKKWLSGLPYLMILAQDMSDMYLISKHSKILIKWYIQNSLKPKSCFQRAVLLHQFKELTGRCEISHLLADHLAIPLKYQAVKLLSVQMRLRLNHSPGQNNDITLSLFLLCKTST